MSQFEKMNIGRQQHSINVAKVSKHLASKLGLVEHFAFMGGMFHDIGYSKENGVGHSKSGYEMLVDNGLTDIAYIALLHSMSDKFDTSIKETLPEGGVPENLKQYIDIISVSDFLIGKNGSLVGLDARLAYMRSTYGLDSLNYKIGLKQRDHANKWLANNKIDVSNLGGILR